LTVPITEQHTEESLCFAHIYALAGVAGVNYSANRYDYGIDGHFIPVKKRGSRFIDTGFPLDYQAKATVNWELKDGKIVYDLEAKTYNDLVERTVLRLRDARTVSCPEESSSAMEIGACLAQGSPLLLTTQCFRGPPIALCTSPKPNWFQFLAAQGED
jgi:hypothetical protein